MSNITDINEFRTKYDRQRVNDRIASKAAQGLMDDLAIYDEKLRNGPYRRSEKPIDEMVEILINPILDEHKRLMEKDNE